MSDLNRIRANQVVFTCPNNECSQQHLIITMGFSPASSLKLTSAWTTNSTTPRYGAQFACPKCKHVCTLLIQKAYENEYVSNAVHHVREEIYKWLKNQGNQWNGDPKKFWGDIVTVQWNDYSLKCSHCDTHNYFPQLNVNCLSEIESHPVVLGISFKSGCYSCGKKTKYFIADDALLNHYEADRFHRALKQYIIKESSRSSEQTIEIGDCSMHNGSYNPTTTSGAPISSYVAELVNTRRAERDMAAAKDAADKFIDRLEDHEEGDAIYFSYPSGEETVMAFHAGHDCWNLSSKKAHTAKSTAELIAHLYESGVTPEDIHDWE